MLANLYQRASSTFFKSQALLNLSLPMVYTGARDKSDASLGFTEKNLDEIKKNYARSDKNLDFNLDIIEFNNFIKFTIGRRLNSVDLDQLFTKLDGDSDGQLTYHELLAHLERRFRKPSRGQIEFAFCTYDKNEDGYLKLHELRQALFFLGFPANMKQIKTLLLKYDTDHDNQITLEEFVKIVLEEMPHLVNL